ncbi:TPA: hypothetical protein HA241_06325 [Candidatus Woesearchaeota archaeon]|nr:hypothetical protein [Candidatus Woesearchaeota archaeon]
MTNTSKKKAVKKHHPKSNVHKENDPEYMIQISDPSMVRKDILESLREVIIFMQGYEKFTKIQKEKVTTIATLKEDVKGLKGLIEQKLKKYLPQGKLKSIVQSEETAPPDENRLIQTPTTPSPLPPRVGKELSGEIEQLESQLKDIESQLRTLG